MTKLELYQNAFGGAVATLDIPNGAALDAKTAELATSAVIADSDYPTWKQNLITVRTQMLSLRRQDEALAKQAEQRAALQAAAVKKAGTKQTEK